MVLYFQKIDALGFHTYKQYANVQMSIERAQGFTGQFTKEHKKTFFKSNVTKSILTIVGYIPVIGTILAIVKLIFSNYIENIKSNTQEYTAFMSASQSYRTGEKIRSWFEVTSLGILLLIPDLIVTIGRNISNKSAG